MNNDTPQYVCNLDNLVPHTQLAASWSDRYSSIAIAWPNAEKPGLQSLVALVGFGGTIITSDQLLSWQVMEDSQPLALSVKERNFRPDWVREVDTADGLEITATVAWPLRNTLAVEFTVRNLGRNTRNLEMQFTAPGMNQPPGWTGPFPVEHFSAQTPVPECHFVSIDGEPEGSWSTLYPAREHGRGVIWVQNFVSGMQYNTTYEMCCITSLEPRSLALEPGQSEHFVIPLAFGRWRRESRGRYDQCQKMIEDGWTPADESRRIIELLNSAPRIAEKYRGKEAYERLYAHAITSLNSLFIQGDGGYTGNKRLTWTAKTAIALGFFWDTSFACAGAREFNAPASQESIECFTDHPSPRNGLPGTICDTHRAGEGQSPIMSWSAWSIYQRSQDKEWLARVYPALAANNDFWFKYHSSPRGLCQFFNAGQVADNDARFDPIQGHAFNQNLDGFESPDLNAFLVMDMKCLAGMADALGLDQEAAEWRGKAGRLGRLIIETMYFPEEAMFYDVVTGSREKLTGVKNPNMFLPLWAGVPLPEAEIKKIIEQHMLNPDEFFRERPFPSLSYDDPKYYPTGYWRGRVWPHVVYWMIQTLWRHGYHEEAELTADRLLTLLQTSPWLHENYASKEGLPPGLPDYNWTLATTIELLLEAYKEPLP